MESGWSLDKLSLCNPALYSSGVLHLGEMRVLRETHTKSMYFGSLSQCGQNIADSSTPGFGLTTYNASRTDLQLNSSYIMNMCQAAEPALKLSAVMVLIL